MLRGMLLVAALAACSVEAQLVFGGCRKDADCRVLGDVGAKCVVDEEGHSGKNAAPPAKSCVCSDQLTPAPETPAPETPAPETPAPETPAPETPAPETPAPETPAPETPDLKSRKARALSDEKAEGAEETPVPETAAPVPTYGRVSDALPICVAKIGGTTPPLALGVRVWYAAADCAKVDAEVRKSYADLLATVLGGNVTGSLQVSCGLPKTPEPTDVTTTEETTTTTEETTSMTEETTTTSTTEETTATTEETTTTSTTEETTSTTEETTTTTTTEETTTTTEETTSTTEETTTASTTEETTSTTTTTTEETMTTTTEPTTNMAAAKEEALEGAAEGQMQTGAVEGGAEAVHGTVGVSVAAVVAADAAKVAALLEAGALAQKLAAEAPEAVVQALGEVAEAALVSGFECGAETKVVAVGAVKDLAGRCQPLGCAEGYVMREAAEGQFSCEARAVRPADADDDDGLTDGQVAGIALGCVGALILAVMVVLVLRGGKKETSETNEPPASA